MKIFMTYEYNAQSKGNNYDQCIEDFIFFRKEFFSQYQQFNHYFKHEKCCYTKADQFKVLIRIQGNNKNEELSSKNSVKIQFFTSFIIRNTVLIFFG